MLRSGEKLYKSFGTASFIKESKKNQFWTHNLWDKIFQRSNRLNSKAIWELPHFFKLKTFHGDLWFPTFLECKVWSTNDFRGEVEENRNFPFLTSVFKNIRTDRERKIPIKCDYHKYFRYQNSHSDQCSAPFLYLVCIFCLYGLWCFEKLPTVLSSPARH